MSAFITETWLRERHSLSEGTELRLPANARLTPAARTLIESRRLTVKYHDEQGRLYRESEEGEVATLEPVHGLTGSSEKLVACCQLCHQPAARKPEGMTHLNAHELVAKNDPRLRLRAQLDAAIAQAVWLQVELREPGELALWLADIRSVLGQVMRADVLGEPLAGFAIGGLDDEALHRISHAPLKYLGHDHLVPEVAHGRTGALLNLLRAKVREVEVTAAEVFMGVGYQLQRKDLLHGLNRLSSALYVAMLLSVLHGRGQPWPSHEALLQRLQGDRP
ncbi:ethanolamine utilization cob(I)yrinic acid a,c-diamide adenosyltransferase EutT [Pseudomonas nitroreducens]|uniref:ethanolamine utilization cob(I)yrinic acid a,c-diamide adenosyltransferase EutT n=1 Tax=Pseudomonas nitroreducens TaxID=46680 RepID=UPI00209FBA9B|nr:ethanolamine utilization cob(I)yrinic acid a,c-diamide adenosyltransferase EutT [Pseudomonas nitroreducens]MCP1624674.1 ethanolamine utilization cobalamin adenosyltransferase [Pseudomonas nitroreducens]